ncbi:replication-relaxation family protein [Paenibacillus lactis]|uniref:replication-relaxation family protein n=1 Tax=Paenibacillus lactis TaxID=228574 RepID=UPI00203BB5BF|nr:replication-relaxation family protein [Paenibacillus lactis]MCM3497660.1 replication-relaxation family protein [Paenibacillus lactis]
MNLTQLKLNRWMEILSSFDSFGFLTTSQVQRLHNLGGIRNTLRILTDMREYLNSYREGETVWYLNATGRKTIGSQTVRKRNQATHHAIARNEVYIARRPELWKPEYSIKWDGRELVCDALYRSGKAYTFVEIDITQTMAANERKIAAYRELRDSGRWQARYGEFPAILFVTSSEHRRKRLTAAVGDMRAEVVTFDDLR